jgi:anaerobic selenocysteine-containing dehydrogenase
METVRAVCAHDCPDTCSLLVKVENDQVIQVRGDPDHPFTAGFACTKTNRDAELINSSERLSVPLRRIGGKGEGDFTPITWDEALDEIADRWRAIIDASGPLAILGYAYSAHTGLMNRGLLNGVFHALGASRLEAGTVCDSCAIEAWNATLGPVGGADPESVVDSDLLISWGCDLITTNVHMWAKITRERKRGLKVIVIDPRRSRTALSADWHIPIRVGTDAALALGVMHILVRDDLCDRAYIAEHTLGFDRLETEVLPRFAPQRVASITGLSIEDIERLAAAYGTAKASFIRLGEGMTRLAQGGQALRAVALLPGVTGAYATQGGGSLLYTGDFCEIHLDVVGQPSGPATARTINHLRLGQALLEEKDPTIQSIFIASNNPAVTCPDVGKVRRGLAREDLFTVVHDPFMSVTARYADIVLPAALYLETEDVYRSYGSYYVQYAPRAVAPRAQAWSNFRLAQALAKRMHLTAPVFQMPEQEVLRELLRGANGSGELNPEEVSKGLPIKVAPQGGQQFLTPSGKLEFYSAYLKAKHVAPMPDWGEDAVEKQQAALWPLRLLTAPGYFQPHTTYSGVAMLRRQEGVPVVVLHPHDAQSRKLRDGQRVRVFNDQGSIGLVLHISDEVQTGVAFVPGQRRDDETVSGTINMLCSDRYTDMGEGATYQSTWLDVARWENDGATRARSTVGG